ncbi:MAG: hypothetical protein AAF519_10145 [Bacteroidota bacterium]
MKNIFFALAICFFMCTDVNVQGHSFIPDRFRLISETQIIKKSLRQDLDHICYEKGRKTTFQDITPIVMQRRLSTPMFEDLKVNYQAPADIEPQTMTENEKHNRSISLLLAAMTGN